MLLLFCGGEKMNKVSKILIVNAITFIRVMGIFLIICNTDLGGIKIGILSLLIYFTDVIDGVLARYWNVSTFFGALLDGLADKLFTIVNFIILYVIVKDIALIPIIIELLIIVIQLIKFSLNMNIKSNLVGKLKIWVLAISVVLTYFVSDITNLTFLGTSTINYLNSIDKNILYSITLGPAIIFETFTLISYLLEFFFHKNIEAALKPSKKVEKVKLKGKTRLIYLKEVWFNPEFYYKHKDETNLNDLRKESKKEIN